MYIAWKDLLLEWRQKYAVVGIVVYLLASLFIIYLSFKSDQMAHYHALLWITILSAVVSYATKSFMQESRNRSLYYFQLLTPGQFILGKIILNILLAILLAFLNLAVFSTVLGFEAIQLGRYCLFIVVGSASLGTLFTMSAAIASQTKNGALIMPVISFPLQIPVFLVLIKGSIKAVEGISASLFYKDILLLLFLTFLNIMLAYILFPYLTKD